MAALALLLSFFACSDNDSTSGGGSDPKSDIADYTVIYWSMNGKLDEAVCGDLCTLYNMRDSGKIGSNVNFVGLVKTSSNTQHNKFLQDSLKKYNLDGTLYIDLPAKPTAPLPYMDSNKNIAKTPEKMVQVYQAYNAKHYGDTLYPLNNPDTLAAFIKKAAETHPAKHYVLMFLGHGSGFNISDDAPNPDAYTTRSCVRDLYTNHGISADNIVAAINKSGVHIQSLFFQCCLMATLENLAAYQHCADYAIISAEVTTSGYLQNYVAGLSKAGDDLEQMKTESRALVDYYVDVANKDDSLYTSHGFWDLSKVSTILGTVAKISDWYSNAMEIDPEYISIMIAKTSQILDYDMEISKVAQDSVQAKTLLDHRKWVLNFLSSNEARDAATIDTLTQHLVEIARVPMTCGFSLAHLVNITLSAQSMSNGTLDFSTLKTLYEEYMNELISASYIRATFENKKLSANYNYIFCSPTVNIFSMNKKHFRLPGILRYDEATLKGKLQEFNQTFLDGDDEKQDSLYDDIFNGCYITDMTLEEVMSCYQATQFDQQCHWSTFLEKLIFNPSYIFNPSRSDYDQ